MPRLPPETINTQKRQREWDEEWDDYDRPHCQQPPPACCTLINRPQPDSRSHMRADGSRQPRVDNGNSSNLAEHPRGVDTFRTTKSFTSSRNPRIGMRSSNPLQMHQLMQQPNLYRDRPSAEPNNSLASSSRRQYTPSHSSSSLWPSSSQQFFTNDQCSMYQPPTERSRHAEPRFRQN